MERLVEKRNVDSRVRMYSSALTIPIAIPFLLAITGYNNSDDRAMGDANFKLYARYMLLFIVKILVETVNVHSRMREQLFVSSLLD